MSRSERRAIERHIRRPGRPHHDSRAMSIPLAFAATEKMKSLLGLRDRQAIDAVISGQGTHEDLQASVTIAVTAAHACAIALETPALAALIEGIDEVRAWLAGECMAALVRIFERRESTGRIGVSGPDRDALLQLADIADQIREALPRRVLHEAFSRSLRVASLRAALGISEVAA